uniref:Venom peptide n=1 Tax=Panagrellus redivivus TaxID=6233 RepID=A0A7E4VQS3_PANRE
MRFLFLLLLISIPIVDCRISKKMIRSLEKAADVIENLQKWIEIGKGIKDRYDDYHSDRNEHETARRHPSRAHRYGGATYYIG